MPDNSKVLHSVTSQASRGCDNVLPGLGYCIRQRGNSGMTNIRGKPKKLGKDTAPDPISTAASHVWIRLGLNRRPCGVLRKAVPKPLVNNYQQTGIQTLWRATSCLLWQAQIIMGQWWCQRALMDTWWRTVARLHSNGQNTWPFARVRLGHALLKTFNSVI